MKFSDGIISLVTYGYSTLLTLIRLTVFPFLKNMDRKRNWDLAGRLKIPAAIRDYRHKKVVWVHAASLGKQNCYANSCQYSKSATRMICM